MTLFDFLDRRYKELSLELQVNFTIPKDAELKAAYGLIQWQRTFFKVLKTPLLFAEYVLVNLHLKKLKEFPPPKQQTTPVVLSEEAATESLQ